MPKPVSFDQETREAILRGVEKLARAGGMSPGQLVRNAVLDQGWGSPKVTKDGVTVAQDIDLEDKFENMGVQFVKDVMSKTSDIAGDGTTTATVLAEAIYRNGIHYIASGIDPMAISRGAQKAVDAVVEELKNLAKPVKADDRKSVEAVATVAGNNDKEIGRILADALLKVGKDGVITIEEGRQIATEVELVEGMQFERGYLSPYFVTDPENQLVELDNCRILICEERISNAKSLVPLLEKVANAGVPLLIIAEDIEGEALATLVVNKLRGILKVCAVKAPGYGDRRKAMLEDLAVLTGGQAVFKDLGVTLEAVELNELGTAKKVRIDAENTTIVQGAGTKAALEGRVAQICQEITKTDSEYDREKLQERLAKLVGGVARISVGARTETEVKERKDRFDDALAATRAAIEEGVVPGGGVALLRCAAALDKVKVTGDEIHGVALIKSVLEIPIQTIAENAGRDGAVVANNVRKAKDDWHGYDTLNDRYGDMFDFGVVDPAKVVRSALQNAVGVANLLLTADRLIVETPKKIEIPGQTRAHPELDDAEVMSAPSQSWTRSFDSGVLSFGTTIYPLKQSLTEICTQIEQEEFAYEIKELPELIGKGVTKSEAQQDFMRQFHIRFQSQIGVPQFRRSQEEQSAWRAFETVVDIEKYKAHQPAVSQQIGMLQTKDYNAWSVWWLDGDGVETVDLAVTPPEFAALEVGQWFEALIERDPVSLSMNRILYVKCRPPLRDLSSKDAAAWLNSLPTGNHLPEASSDLSMI